MRIRRCPCWLLAALCIAVLGTGADTLFAQNSLPPDVLGAAAELTDAQKKTVDDYVVAQVARLRSSDPQDVAEGRANLAEPFGLSNSSFFKDYYSQSIARRVVPLLDPEQPLITRLNVAIVSAKLNGQDLVPILEAGAADASPAVRYWIAKAVGTAAKQNAFTTTEQQRTVLNVLADRLKAEDSSLVLEQVMVALAEIDLPDAVQIVLEGLDGRVVFHLNNPDARFKPVMGGMQQLWSKLIAQASAGENVRDEVYELARIAYRYYELIGDQLDSVDPQAAEVDQIKDDKARMASLCGRVMEYAVKTVAGQSAPQLVDTKIAAQVKASAALWHDILKGSPFNHSDEDLAVDRPAE